MDSIKVNGGSFKITAVLSYSDEGSFVEYYNKILPTWLTEERRIATLREVYKIARDIKKYEDDCTRNARKISRGRRGSSGKNDARSNEATDNRQEPRTVDTGDSL